MISTFNISKYVIRFGVMVFLISLLTSLFAQQSHAYLSGFSAGNIMSDAVMSNKNSMSESQIQSFLKSKNACNDSRLHRLSGYNANEGWLHSNGKTFYYNLRNGKFVCMADENFNGESAARIIWQASQDYNVNPQVIIVLLQKEQGLVTDTWPNKNHQYAAATGYDCPDNGNGCNNANAGFKTQIRKAAALFRTVLNGGWSNYPVGVNYVQYHPNKGCGGTNVNIVNRATSALYRYTPYQPNQAALNAGYGTGDGCSAYGNRNFYNYFTDWFGPTTNRFTPLDVPRWMQLKTNLYKTNLSTYGNIDPLLQSGRQIYFPDKYFANNQWYLRSRWDKDNNNMAGMALTGLEEIPPSPITPVWMSTKAATKKVDPIREKNFESVESMTGVRVVDTVTVNGKTFYRTAWENQQGQPRFLPADALEQFKFYSFIKPRTLYTKKDAKKIDVRTGQIITTIPQNTYLYFNRRITIDGTLYVQISTDNGTYRAISMGDLNEAATLPFVSLDNPRWMKLRINTTKRHLPSEQTFAPELLSGREIYFPDKVYINGKWYLRTQWDKESGNTDGIPLSDLEEM